MGTSMHHRQTSVAIAIFVCGWVTTGAALAVPAAFVSGTGTDAGNCTVAAPCRSLQFAHDKTDAGGTIHVVSSGFFEPLKITKSINVLARDVTALIQGGAGFCGDSTTIASVCVTAGAADTVRLSGVTIDMVLATGQGLKFNSGAALYVENCLILRTVNFEPGINFAPTGASDLYVSDTTFIHAGTGIQIRPVIGGSASVTINRTHIEKSTGAGITVIPSSATAKVTIRDSVLAGNTSAGLAVQTNGTALFEQTALVNNGGRAIQAVGDSVVRISRSTITNNPIALDKQGGQFIVYSNNKIEGNGDDPITPLSISR